MPAPHYQYNLNPYLSVSGLGGLPPKMIEIYIGKETRGHFETLMEFLHMSSVSAHCTNEAGVEDDLPVSVT